MDSLLADLLNKSIHKVCLKRIYGQVYSDISIQLSTRDWVRLFADEVIHGDMETYGISFHILNSSPECKFPPDECETLQLDAVILRVEILSRAEWLSAVSDGGWVGLHPKMQEWSKVDEVPSGVKDYSVVDCGVLLTLSGQKQALFYITDYPEGLGYSDNETEINSFCKSVTGRAL